MNHAPHDGHGHDHDPGTGHCQGPHDPPPPVHNLPPAPPAGPLLRWLTGLAILAAVLYVVGAAVARRFFG